MSSTPDTRPGERSLLAGVVALEFGAAVSSLTLVTLLPAVVADLGARDRLGVLVAAPLVGSVTALPLAGPAMARLGRDRAFLVGVALLLAGTAVAATAVGGLAYGAGGLLRGLGGGLLGVFGVAAVVESLGERARRVLVTLSTAMWVVPSLVGPAAASALEHALGWRFALLLPLPFVLVGRGLIARVTRALPAPPGTALRPRALLVPLGAVVVVGTAALGAGPVVVGGAVAGSALLALGVRALVPAPLLRPTPGAAAAVGALMAFGVGWAVVGSLVSLVAGERAAAGPGGVAVAVSAGPLAWALGTVATSRLPRTRSTAVGGMVLAALGTAGVAAVAAADRPASALLVLTWAAAGAGVGIGYPVLYVVATDAGSVPGTSAVTLATAVVSAEAVGELAGGAAGPSAVPLLDAAGLPGLAVVIAAAAGCLALAAWWAIRAMAATGAGQELPGA